MLLLGGRQAVGGKLGTGARAGTHIHSQFMSNIYRKRPREEAVEGRRRRSYRKRTSRRFWPR